MAFFYKYEIPQQRYLSKNKEKSLIACAIVLISQSKKISVSLAYDAPNPLH